MVGLMVGLSAGPASAADLLWDETHGVYCSGSCYDINGYYSIMAASQSAQGHTFTRTSASVAAEDLYAYDAVIMNIATAWTTPYNAPEVAAIEDYVFNGGGLVVMCDSNGVANSHLRPITQAFGID